MWHSRYQSHFKHFAKFHKICNFEFFVKQITISIVSSFLFACDIFTSLSIFHVCSSVCWAFEEEVIWATANWFYLLKNLGASQSRVYISWNCCWNPWENWPIAWGSRGITEGHLQMGTWVNWLYKGWPSIGLVTILYQHRSDWRLCFWWPRWSVKLSLWDGEGLGAVGWNLAWKKQSVQHVWIHEAKAIFHKSGLIAFKLTYNW